MDSLWLYTQQNNPIVLLDLCLTSMADKDDVVNLIRLCKSVSTCFIAISSGSGTQFGDTRTKEILDKVLFEYENITFLPFTKKEALLFVKMEVEDDRALEMLKVLKPYTRRNPYLLNLALNKKSLTDSCASCHNATRRYIERTLPEETNPFFLEQVEEIVEYIRHKTFGWML